MHQPSVVLMDIAMPGLNGLEAAALVSRDHPATRTIVLSMHGIDAYVLQALRAGAAGYLLKDAAVAELPLALRAVLRGEIYISSAVSRVVVSGFLAGMAAADAAGRSPVDALSARQREILQLVAEGRSIKEIASALKMSIKTVETHRRQVMERLQIFDIRGTRSLRPPPRHRPRIGREPGSGGHQDWRIAPDPRGRHDPRRGTRRRAQPDGRLASRRCRARRAAARHAALW